MRILSFVARPIRRWLSAHSSDAARRRRRANQIASTVLAELARLGFERKTVEGNRKRRKRRHYRIKFDYPLLLTHDEIWLPIQHKSIPIGRTPDELRAEEVVNSLADRINCGVRVEQLATGPMCYVVRLAGSSFPEKFSLNKFDMPAEAPALAFPLGVDSAGEQVVGDLIEFKHLLICGATGGGKTTLFHSMITTLISRNDANSLELWLIDMKRTEFALYRGLLGTRDKAGVVRHIAVDPEDAVDLLARAFKEITQRNQHMERLGCTSITDLEQSTGQRLKRIVLLVDEFAILTTDSTKVGKQTVGSWSKLLMTRIAALGRSAGVSICIATQMVKKEVIDGMISANFENRIAFSCATWRESNLAVQSSEAEGMPDGRAIVRIEGRTRQVQTCYVAPGQVKLEIARVAEFGPDGGLGNADHLRFVRDAKLLLDAACSQLGGDFARAKLLGLDGIKGTITWDAFDEIARRLERDGILEPGGPRRPRRVARAFHGRPTLLDQFYGVIEADEGPPQARAVPEDESLRSEEAGLRGTHQDAERQNSEEEAVTGYGVDESRTCGDDPDESHTDPDKAEDMAIEQYDVWKKLVAKLQDEQPPPEEPPPAEKPKKSRKPKK